MGGKPMDYFKFQRKRVYLPLNMDACKAKFTGNDELDISRKCEDPAWHPHVVLEARPTFGALQFVREISKALTMARREARSAVDADSVKDYVASLTEAEYKAKRDEYLAASDAYTINGRPDLVDVLTDAMVFSNASVMQAAKRVMLSRVAVCVRALGGDFTCYSETWDDTPEWPNLERDDALETRMAILTQLADEDISRLNAMAKESMEVSNEEAGKSEQPPAS
jgi:hypothetical protein